MGRYLAYVLPRYVKCIVSDLQWDSRSYYYVRRYILSDRPSVRSAATLHLFQVYSHPFIYIVSIHGER
jgi:hypothetical protein